MAAALAGLALALWALVRALNVLLLAFLGVLFAVFVDAVARLLQRATRLPRGWSLTVAAAAVLALLIGGGWLLAPQVVGDAVRLAEQVPASLAQMEESLRNTDWGRSLLNTVSDMETDATLGDTARRFMGVFANLVGVLTAALVILVLGLYLAIEPQVYIRGTLRLFPPRARDRAREVAEELGHALRWWLLGRLASMFVVFLLTWGALLLLGLPLAFLLALIAGFLSFIPNLGPILAAVPAVLVGLAEGPQQALWVVVAYLLVQTVESYSITPLIQRRAVQLLPALLLSFQLVMGAAAGFLGLFVATPVLVVLMVLVRMLYIQDRLKEDIGLP
jgi:predicted PurR-regulated permease PerM